MCVFWKLGPSVTYVFNATLEQIQTGLRLRAHAWYAFSQILDRPNLESPNQVLLVESSKLYPWAIALYNTCQCITAVYWPFQLGGGFGPVQLLECLYLHKVPEAWRIITCFAKTHLIPAVFSIWMAQQFHSTMCLWFRCVTHLWFRCVTHVSDKWFIQTKNLQTIQKQML